MPAPYATFAKRAFSDALVRAGYSSAMVADARRAGRWWLAARSGAARRRRGVVAGWTVLWTDSGRADLVPVEVPLAGHGEVTVELDVTVVSPGTERAQFVRLQHAQVELPYVPGYSGVGRVRAVGRGVTDLEVGDRVAAIHAPHASVVTLPAVDVFALPDGVGVQEGALIRLGIVAGYGVHRAEPEIDEDVVVVGAGAIATLAERLARARGVASTTVVARSVRRREAMLAAGTDRFLSTEEDPDEVAALAAPLVVEATGVPEAAAVAVRLAAGDGRVVLLGSPRGRTRGLPLGLVRERRLRLIGAHVAQLPNETARLGYDLERNIGVRFLAELAASRVRVDDLVGSATDPREATRLYRSLADDPSIVGAHFDWRYLPAADRPRRSRFLKAPPIGAQGIDLERKPERVAVSGGDEFARAAGDLRIALVGCGDIATRNAAAAVAAPNVTLATCFDPVRELAESLAQAHGCDVDPTLEALLDRRDVDAVFLCVPHDLHAPLALQAIAARKHLVVEKPLANNLSEALAIVTAAEDAGVTLSVCFPHRFTPGASLARKLVAEGALGELGGTLTSFLTDKPLSYWHGGFSGRAQSDWRTSRARAGGGVLIMNLTHYVDLVRYVTGVEVDLVTGVCASADRVAEVEDTISVGLHYENGAIGTLFGCSAVRGIDGRNELRIWGRDGQLSLEPDLRVFSLRPVDGFRSGRWSSPQTDDRNIRTVYLSRLATAIAEGREPDVTADDALAVQALVEAAYRAHEGGTAVRPRALLESRRS